MSSSSELAQLYLTLQTVTAPMMSGFAETATAGEEMVTKISTALAELNERLAQTTEQFATMRAEMATAGEGATAIGAEASTAQVGATAVGAEAATAAGGAAAAGASVDPELAAEREQMAQMAAEEAELEAQIQAGYDAISARFAEISADADAAAASWSADFAKMVDETIALSDAMEATAVKVDAAWADMAESEAAYDAKQKAITDSAPTALGNVTGSLLKMGAAGGILAAATVKMAADFQSSTTRLVTSGGELAKNLQSDQQGILSLAGQVGYTADQLSTAMYKITSSGQQGAQALDTLKASAEGAKTENADLTTVADAVSTAMIDYRSSGMSAATVTSKLVAATSQGKTTFQELAGAMSAILPKASAAHINFSEILGDLASMTQHGMSADQAAQNLANAISHLQSPTMAMSKEMAALGLNSTQLSQNLGTKGLYGTINEISQAIQKDMGPQSTAVILQMQDALKGLPPAVQQLSEEVLNGSASWTDWNTATKGLTVTQRAQAQSFATLVNGMHTIGTEQLSGSQVMQTYAGAMNKAMGTTDGLNVALMLTQNKGANTTKAISAVSKATADASGNVQGWNEIQGTFNQKLSEAKGGLDAAAISVGQKLLPAASALVGVLAGAASWLGSNKVAATALAIAIGVLLAGGVVGLTIKLGQLGVGLVKNLATPFTASIQFAKNFSAGLQGAEGAAESFGGKLGIAAKAIGGWASSAGQAIASGAQWAGSMIAQGYSVATSAISSAATATGAWISSSAKLLAQGVAQTAQWVAQTAAKYTAVVTGAVASAAATTGAWLASTASMIGQGIAQMVTWSVGMIAKFTMVAASAVVEAAATLAAWVAANAGMIIATGGIVLLLGLVVTAAIYLATHWKQIWSDIQNIAKDVADAVTTAWHAVINFFGTVGNFIKNLFGDAKNWLVSAGSDVIHGLWQGIENAATWLWDKVKSIASGIVNTFKSALNIFSPSRTMADEVGQHIPAGIAMGITNGIPALTAAARKAAQAALAGSQSALGSAGAMPLSVAATGAVTGSAPQLAPSLGAGGASPVTVVTIPVTVQGSVITDTTLTQVVQKAILQLSGRNVSFNTNVAFS